MEKKEPKKEQKKEAKKDSKAVKKVSTPIPSPEKIIDIEEEKLDVERVALAEEAPTIEEIVQKVEPKTDVGRWVPKTLLGKQVKSGEAIRIGKILDGGIPIMEAEIVDTLLPGLETDLLLVGQSKGKFGGGQRRVFRQTQRKTCEGNKPSFATVAVVGNKDGFVGIGYGKSRETVPAREKAVRNAKVNIFKVARGCGSWECGCREPHTIPFKVEGRCGSTRIRLMPAPKGQGLVVEGECAKILRLAGIRDVRSKSFGQTRTKINLVMACQEALKNLIKTKMREEYREATGYLEGAITHE